MMQTQKMKLYTVPEVAALLRVKKAYVYDLIYTGRLKALRLSERRFRVCEDAIRMFIEEEQNTQMQNISTYSGISTKGLI